MIRPDSTIKLRSSRLMPVMGLGTWKLTDKTPDIIEAALKLGYTMIDTSGDYGTQPGIGKGIEKSNASRDDFYLVTKVEEYEDAYISIKENLDQLQLDYADLILIHRPPEEGVGKALWDGMKKARDEGLVLDLGVSNYSINQMMELAGQVGEMPQVNQIEWSPFGYSRRMEDFCMQNNIVIQAYSPLTRGERLNDKMLEDIANEHGKTTAQVILRWNLQKGTVPLPKANSYEHLIENIDIFDFELNDDEMQDISDLNEHYSALGCHLLYIDRPIAQMNW